MPSPQQQRRKFKTTQDWNNYFTSIQQQQQPITGDDLVALRTAVYGEIETHRGRPLLVYASKFLDNMPLGVPNSIEIGDVDGFTDLINSLEDCDSIDILLHSPGGSADATERIVSLLRKNLRKAQRSW